jgi:hypothetical protein
VNEEALAHWGLLQQIKKYIYIVKNLQNSISRQLVREVLIGKA